MSTLALSDRIAFYEELRRMVNAGFVLSQAFRTLREKRGTRELSGLYQTLETSCAAGRPLAEGMAQIPWDFCALEIHLVRAGEGSGRLEETLKSLADYYRRRQELVRRIQSALLYPIFLIHVA
ncbi:MAG: type II secretion system F family protein, partial [Planctomycetota bacterium]